MHKQQGQIPKLLLAILTSKEMGISYLPFFKAKGSHEAQIQMHSSVPFIPNFLSPPSMYWGYRHSHHTGLFPTDL